MVNYSGENIKFRKENEWNAKSNKWMLKTDQEKHKDDSVAIAVNSDSANSLSQSWEINKNNWNECYSKLWLSELSKVSFDPDFTWIGSINPTLLAYKTRILWKVLEICGEFHSDKIFRWPSDIWYEHWNNSRKNDINNNNKRLWDFEIETKQLLLQNELSSSLLCLFRTYDHDSPQVPIVCSF